MTGQQQLKTYPCELCRAPVERRRGPKTSLSGRGEHVVCRRSECQQEKRRLMDRRRVGGGTW